MEIRTKDCVPIRQGKVGRIVSEENGCKHVGINERSHEIRQFRIDSGVIAKNAEVLRCDYLVANDTARRAYFIELKGSDVKKAMRQIDNTVAMTKDLDGYAVFPRIIFKGTINVNTSLRTKWSAKYGGRVKIKRNMIEESICYDE